MSLPILRKEFRYRAGGLLALPALLLAGVWGVNQVARTQDAADYQSILSPAFGVPVTMVCAAVGLACGLWQALGETRPGSWAFLRHRPVSTTRLFFGKLGAALLIYLLVTGLPLGWTILWAQEQGHFFGPWLPQMAVPSLVDLLCGTVYVLVGMLIALREARWFGSRLLPVGLAIVCSGLTWIPWLWAALLAIAVAWAVLLPAAWGAMASRGRERRQGWAGRTIMAVTLIPAMVSIPMMTGALLTELLRPRPVSTGSTSYYMQGGAEMYETLYRDGISEYRRVVDEKGVFLRGGPYAADKLVRTSASLVSDWKAAGYTPFRSYRFATSYLIGGDLGYTGRFSRERWCYLHEAGYIVGYSRRDVGEAQLIGYIGANGFTRNLADVTPFQAEADESLAWWSGRFPDLIVESGRIIKVDLSKREVVTVFTVPQGERAVSAAQLAVPLPPANTSTMLWAVATDKASYVIDEHLKVLLRQPHLGAEYPQISVGASADLKTFGLLYAHHANWWDSPKVFIRVSADETLLTRTDIPGIPQPFYPGRPYEAAIGAVCMPPVLSVIGVIHDKPQERLHISPWVLALPMAGCAGVSVAIAFWLLRRSAERRGWTVFWLITVLLLGIGGVLLMLAMRHWPPRVRCGHCGRKSVTTAFTCQHCGTAFPIPDPGPIGIRDDQGACVASA